MKTEFEKLDLNIIRYSLVWESATTFYNGLNIRKSDHVLMITAAGCNVLNVLLKKPTTLTAIDLSPEQNRLLLLKKHIIENHDYAIFSAVMGFCGKAAVQKAWKEISAPLDPIPREYWTVFFLNNPAGILPSGKLESYILRFYPGLPEEFQQKIKKLITFTSLKKQREFFLKELDQTEFKEQFIEYFDQQNLSKGRDPKLFKYVKESGGQIFYTRLKQFIGRQLLKDNFYFHFFMFGPQNLPEAILPPCYRKENFGTLKAQLSTLNIVTGEAIEYLLSREGENINKAGLSNIFEYVDKEQFAEVCQNLFSLREKPLRMIFWNLLQSQGDNHCTEFQLEQISQQLSTDEACFYFNNVIVMETIRKSILTESRN